MRLMRYPKQWASERMKGSCSQTRRLQEQTLGPLPRPWETRIEGVGHFDLILCGRQAIDGDTARIGPQVTDYLRIPQVTYVFGIEEIKKG